MNKEEITSWLILSVVLNIGLIIGLMVANQLDNDIPSIYCKQYNATAKTECTDNNNNLSCFKCCYENNTCFPFENLTLI